MNAKYWAFICVCVLSSEIASATFFWPKPHQKKSGGDKDGHCKCNSRVRQTIGKKMVEIKSSLSESYELQEDTVSEYRFHKGSVKNLHKFKIENYGCSVGRNYVRIFLYISFVELFVRYSCSYVEHIQHNIFGSLVSSLFRLIGKVVGLLLNIVFQVRIIVVLRQNGFGKGSGLVVESIDYIDFRNIKIQNQLRNREEIEKHVSPCVSRGMKWIIERHFKSHIQKHCSDIVVTENDFYHSEEDYEENSSYDSYESGEDDSDDTEHAYVREDSYKKNNSNKKDKSYERKDKYERDGSYVRDDSSEKSDSHKKDKSSKQKNTYVKDGSYVRDDSYKKDDLKKDDKSYERNDSYERDGKYVRDDSSEKSDSQKKDKSSKRKNTYEKDGSYVRDDSYEKDDLHKKDKSYKRNDSYETDGKYVRDDSYEKGDTYKKDKSHEKDQKYRRDGSYESDDYYHKDSLSESDDSYEEKDSYYED